LGKYCLKRGASQCGVAIHIKKYIKAKRRIKGNSNISPGKNIIFKKQNPLKETKILQDVITLYIIIDLKFQHKPKISSSFKKSSYQNRPGT
jgi:hypothetical protein